MSAPQESSPNESRRFPNAHVVQFALRNFTIPVAAGTQALDLGCGSSVNARFLMDCGFSVTEVPQAEVSGFQAPGKTYACAISVGALDVAGMDQARKVVPRFMDALKPGGKALLVFASADDSFAAESGRHGFTRREVESLIVLEFGASAWIDSCTTTYMNDTRRQVDWLVTIAKR